MRICIPATKNEVPNHFGHCEEFLFADVVDGQARNVALMKNPRHGEGGPPPVFVRSQGATHVLAWGMPPPPKASLEAAGITVVLGARGAPRDVLDAYLAGTLKLSEEKLDAGGGCGGKGGCGGHGHDHGHDHDHAPGLHQLKPH